MNEKYIDIVYDLINGTRIRQPGDPDVENLFAIGRECEQLYARVYDSNLRSCHRLGVEEDANAETIINSLLRISELIGKRMYRYGVEFRHE